MSIEQFPPPPPRTEVEVSTLRWLFQQINPLACLLLFFIIALVVVVGWQWMTNENLRNLLSACLAQP